MTVGVNYYFSGVFPPNAEGDFLPMVLKPTHRLVSCHDSYYKMAVHTLDLLKEHRPGHTEVMLDSGAFTAWTQEKEVCISELIDVYSSLVEKYEPFMKKMWLINLDRIPGTVKRAASLQEKEDAKIESMQNFHILEKVFGSRILPVFHQGESWDFLQEVAQANEYICISPQNNVSEKFRILWAKEAHKRIPSNRTHGLATTGKKMVTQVPWYSVDSASWIRQASTGKVTFHIDGHMRPVITSDRSPSLQKGGHFHHLPELVRDTITQKLERYSLSLSDMESNVYARMAVTISETFEWSTQVKRHLNTTGSHLFMKKYKRNRILLER